MCETMTVLGYEACSVEQISHELPIGVNMVLNLFSNKQGVSELSMLCLGEEGRHPNS